MIFFIYAALHSCFFFTLSKISYVFDDFYFNLIEINKFIKHKHINYLYYNSKYLDLYLSLSFLFFFFKKKNYESKMGLLGCLFSLFFTELDFFSSPIVFSCSKKNSFIQKV
jgi:hypothetical protein